MIKKGGEETIRDLLKFIQGIFDGENNLMGRLEIMWSPIIHFSEEDIETRKKVKGASRYSSIKPLLT